MNHYEEMEGDERKRKKQLESLVIIIMGLRVEVV